MTEKKVYYKNLYCHIAWLVVIIFSVIMLVMSLTCQWSNWIANIYTILVPVIISYVTFSKRISEKTHSYFVVYLSMSECFLYSYMQNELYPTLLVVSSLAVMVAIYMNFRLLIPVAIWSMILILLHVFVLGTVDLSSTENVMRFCIRVFSVMFSEIFIMAFVHKLTLTEERLIASAEKARGAEQSKSDFLANMSHEIRTPMNVIIGMCELILRDDINEDVRENCSNIQNSGRSLLAIINDILDFSKIESGKTELIEQEFNIGSTINDVMNMAATRKADKNIEIIAKIDPDIPKGLIGDEVRIKQIIINLVTNAIKFTKSGCVVVTIGQSKHDYGINLKVSVSDTGIGITEENLEKLFTSFQQVDTKKNRSVEGTGLGLAISKSLVSQMGGFINVSSTYGKGSEFKFVIPLKVVDDNPFIYVKDVAKIKAAIYVDLHKFPHPRIKKEYRSLIVDIAEKFNADFVFFSRFSDLKMGLAIGGFTHCFTAKEEYIENEQFFLENADNIKILLVQDRINAIVPDKKIKVIYKPFYAMSIASVFNSEKYVFNVGGAKEAGMRFTAPDAKVLVVDDNINNLKVVEGLMRPYNMHIITATSGKAAIEALRSQDYDIVFMDHMMPEMDGVEATAIIRGMYGEYFKTLPIIALTANAVNGAREMFLASGFNDFIAKPIEMSFMERALKRWIPDKIVRVSDEEEEKQVVSVKTVESEDFKRLFNSDKGLLYAGGNQNTYFDNLKVNVQNSHQYRESLEKRFKEEDWSKYIIEVHALKSSSLSIGAEILSEQAKALEMAGKSENYEFIREKHKELIRLYDRVVEEAEKYLKENLPEEDSVEAESGEVADITEKEFDECIQLLKTACENFDGDEMVLAADKLCKSSFAGKELKPYFAEVKKLADDFEYDKALELAEKAVAEIREVQL